jgi:uncharacterized protein YgiB involved in biofilm formation
VIRALILLFIAGVAGLILYLAFTGECPGGTVLRTLESCPEKLGPIACQQVRSRAKEVAQSAGTVYMDPVQCSVDFGPCLNHATIIGGYVPAPAGFCVLRLKGGSVVDISPLYRRAAAR